jgi:hypothetical protein
MANAVLADERIEIAVRFFKVLADESRIRILGILASRECSVEELAAILSLRAPTVSHHLGRLKDLGLVTMRADGNTHFYTVELEALRTLSKDVLSPDAVAALGEGAVSGAGDAWERKVLRDFFDGERLKEIPASRKKRVIVLRWLADRFEVGARYPESAVNATITRHHPDFATLRRELIGAQLMQRENGIYWRVEIPFPSATIRPSGGPPNVFSGGPTASTTDPGLAEGAAHPAP